MGRLEVWFGTFFDIPISDLSRKVEKSVGYTGSTCAGERSRVEI